VNRLKRILPPLSLIIVLLIVWTVVVQQTESAIFPTPLQVVTGAQELIIDGTLWSHITSSLMRVGAGFLLAVMFAVPLGLWMGRVSAAYMTLNPVFQILRPISPIAWIPIAILWFGVGNSSSSRCWFAFSSRSASVLMMRSAISGRARSIASNMRPSITKCSLGCERTLA